MKKIIAMLFILIVFVMIIGQGCIEQKARQGQITGTTQENVDEIEQGISDVESLDEGMNVSDLDSIGNDIDEINW